MIDPAYRDLLNWAGKANGALRAALSVLERGEGILVRTIEPNGFRQPLGVRIKWNADRRAAITQIEAVLSDEGEADDDRR